MDLFKMRFIRTLMYQPFYVFLLCAGFVLVNLVYDQTAVTLLKLSNKKKELVANIDELQKEYTLLTEKIKIAHSPGYIENQAVDRLSLLKPNDLLIVFSD